MVENRPYLTFISHFVVLLGVAIVAFPVWMTFVASTHDQQTMLRSPIPLLPGPYLIENYRQVLVEGYGRVGNVPTWLTLFNSLVMALGVAFGKILISIISAFAMVYFRFPLRMACFWAIFVTLMLPVEVRIVPTYGVVAALGMLDSYSGLIIPIIASATATFLFRQFFLSVPDELAEAARVDGAGFWRIFRSVMLPMAVPIVTVAVILQVTGIWNDFIFGLVFAGRENFPMTVQLNNIVNSTQGEREYNVDMAAAMMLGRRQTGRGEKREKPTKLRLAALSTNSTPMSTPMPFLFVVIQMTPQTKSTALTQRIGSIPILSIRYRRM